MDGQTPMIHPSPARVKISSNVPWLGGNPRYDNRQEPPFQQPGISLPRETEQCNTLITVKLSPCMAHLKPDLMLHQTRSNTKVTLKQTWASRTGYYAVLFKVILLISVRVLAGRVGLFMICSFRWNGGQAALRLNLWVESCFLAWTSYPEGRLLTGWLNTLVWLRLRRLSSSSRW